MSSPKFGAQPRANEPVVGRDGLVTQAWRDYFARLAMAQTSDDLRQLYEALAARVAELADGQSLRVVGRNSVDTAGASVVEIQLVGDESAPGNTEYYGTGPTGQRGFFPIANAIAVDTGELEKSVGSDGVITLGLADVPDEGGGTLQKTAFDAKGRKTGTSEATTTDLSEGTNLYFTDERAAAAAPVQSVNGETGDVVLDASDVGAQPSSASLSSLAGLTTSANQGTYLTGSGTWATYSLTAGGRSLAGVAGTANTFPYFSAANTAALAAITAAGRALIADVDAAAQRTTLGLASGTTGQFWRGDGAWSNSLDGPLVLGSLSASLGFTFGLTQEFGDATIPSELLVRYANAVGGGFVCGMKARGTKTTPAAVTTNDQLIAIRGGGYHSAGGWSGTQAAEIILLASEPFTETAQGTKIQLRTTALGATTRMTGLEIDSGRNIVPGSDNAQNVGSASLRLKEVFAATGTINTSDAREKTQVRPLTASELAAAAELGSAVGAYQWLAMVEAKGEAARQHIGMTVQQAIAILESHGLDPFAYGFVCYDEWDERPEVVGEEGEIAQAYRPAGNRYSFRMDELLAFIARGLAHRLDTVEQRLAAAGL